MDRIKRISLEILQDYKEKFGVDFVENKKILDNISTIRSKELKNELAGYITKFIKHEIRDKEEKAEQLKKHEQMTSEENQTLKENETQPSQNNPEKSAEENVIPEEQTKTS